MSAPNGLAPASPCRHPVNVGGLCAHCGASISLPPSASNSPVPPTRGGGDSGASSLSSSRPSSPPGSPPPPPDRASSKLTLGSHTIAVAPSYASSFAARERARLRAARRLTLVLDLDHTLVHCVANPLAAKLASEKPDEGGVEVRTFLLPAEAAPIGGAGNLFGCTDPRYCGRHFLALRPGLKEFLTSAKEK